MSINIQSRVVRGAVAAVGTAVVATVALWAPGALADGEPPSPSAGGPTCIGNPPQSTPTNDPSLIVMCIAGRWTWVRV
jgi:hypothetical protein